MANRKLNIMYQRFPGCIWGETERYHEALTSPEEEQESVYSDFLGEKPKCTNKLKTNQLKTTAKKKKTKPNKQEREINSIYLVTRLLIALPGGSPDMIVPKASVVFCQMPNTSHAKEAQMGRDCCFLNPNEHLLLF